MEFINQENNEALITNNEAWEKELTAADLMGISGGLVNNNNILQFNGEDSDLVDIDDTANNL